jgi:hypothetical protein
MQIGRITGLPEPQGFSQPDMSTVSFGLLASGTQAKQLLDLGSNGAERFVPIIFGTALAANDGVYELLDVGVDGDPNLEVAGLRQVSVSARCENRGKQVANSQLLVRGDNRDRTADVGVTGPLYRVAIPAITGGGAQAPSSYNAGPAGFTAAFSATPTLRGDVLRVVDRTQPKAVVACATTPAGGNIDLTTGGLLTIDTLVLTDGDRVLVKDQTDSTEEGIWVAAAGAWTRATDADSGTELYYAHVPVASGAVNGGTTWFIPTFVSITGAKIWQQYPAFGLRESDRGGPVSITYRVSLGSWYNGACTITEGGTVVTGNRLAGSGVVTMDNGLVRVELLAGVLYLEIASGSPLGFKGRATGQRHEISGFGNQFLGGAAVLVNTPDLVALRFRDASGAVDVSLTRGARTVSVTLSLTSDDFVQPLLNDGSSPNFGSREAGSGPGFGISEDYMLYASADDDFSNRVGLSYAGALGSFDESLFAKAHAFGIHAVVGGGTTKTGNDQLYGLSREWFAMIAQQTSAGVL